MKLILRKIYCNHCERLVFAKTEKTPEATRYTCPRCKNLIRLYNGISWITVK